MKVIKKIVCIALCIMLTTVTSITGFAAEKGRIYGDVDGNGEIMITDATLLQKDLAQIELISDENRPLADVDGDGELSIIDATCIQKYIVGLVGSGKTGEAYQSEADKMQALRQRVLEIVNEERAANELQPLTLDSDVTACADIRAQEITQVFDHVRPNGESCFTVFTDMDVPIRYVMGENIAYGQPTSEAVMHSWMNSPPHRENILRPGFHKIGVGIYEYGGVYHWVQLFMG